VTKQENRWPRWTTRCVTMCDSRQKNEVHIVVFHSSSCTWRPPGGWPTYLKHCFYATVSAHARYVWCKKLQSAYKLAYVPASSFLCKGTNVVAQSILPRNCLQNLLLNCQITAVGFVTDWWTDCCRSGCFLCCETIGGTSAYEAIMQSTILVYHTLVLWQNG